MINSRSNNRGSDILFSLFRGKLVAQISTNLAQMISTSFVFFKLFQKCSRINHKRLYLVADPEKGKEENFPSQNGFSFSKIDIFFKFFEHLIKNRGISQISLALPSKWSSGSVPDFLFLIDERGMQYKD